jgi:hypothetical protein
MIGDLPAGFSLNATPIANALYSNTGFDMPQPQIMLADVDAIPTGSGANETLGATPTKLFDVVYNVAGSVPVGMVLPLRILIPGGGLENLFNVAGPNNPSVSVPSPGMPTVGSLTVIPEPGGFQMLFAAATLYLSCFGVRHWRGIRWRRAPTE